MMDLQQVTKDVGIASNYLTYCLAKTPIKQKKELVPQCEPEFYNMNQSNLTFYCKIILVQIFLSHQFRIQPLSFWEQIYEM